MRCPSILLVNGNSCEPLTKRMTEIGRNTFQGIAEIEPMTINAAPPFVADRAQATHAASAILCAVHQRLTEPTKPHPDAVMLACFGEPGLHALRDTLSIPVTGMVEASVHSALQLGRRVSILTSGSYWPAQIEDLLDIYGQSERVLRVTAVPEEALSEDRATWIPALTAAVARDAALGGADTLILGGGPLSGRSAELTPPPGLVLIDAFDATLWQSFALASLQLKRSSQRSGSSREARLKWDRSGPYS